MKKTVVINLFGGPGCGKTTTAMMIAVGLKKIGFEVEYIPEYAKQLYYEGNLEMLDGSFEHELEIISEIYNQLQIYNGKVDVIVTDSALLQSVNYIKENKKKELLEIAYEYHRQFRNVNFFIARAHDFKEEGRVHTYNESVKIDNEILPFISTIEPIDIIDDRTDELSVDRQIFNIATLLQDLKDELRSDVPSIGESKLRKNREVYIKREEPYYKNFNRYYNGDIGVCYVPKLYFGKGKNKNRVYNYKDFMRITRNKNEADKLFEDVSGELPETLQRKYNKKIEEKLKEALEKVLIEE